MCSQPPTAGRPARQPTLGPSSSRFYQSARFLHAAATGRRAIAQAFSAAKGRLAPCRHAREGRPVTVTIPLPANTHLRASPSCHSRSSPGETDPPFWSPTRISSSCESSPQRRPSPVRPTSSRPLGDPVGSLLSFPISLSGSKLPSAAKHAKGVFSIDQHGAPRAPCFLSHFLYRTFPQHRRLLGKSSHMTQKM